MSNRIKIIPRTYIHLRTTVVTGTSALALEMPYLPQKTHIKELMKNVFNIKIMREDKLNLWLSIASGQALPFCSRILQKDTFVI